MGKKPEVLLRAIEAFFVGQRFVHPEMIVSSYDPVVKGRESLFQPIEVEQATAAPGEKRNVAIPESKPAPEKSTAKKSTAKKPAAKKAKK